MNNTTGPKRIPFTREKYEAMQAEEKELTREREEVVVRLATAREMGDLSENGAYKYAKQELGDINRKLRQLAYFLQYGEIIEQDHKSDAVRFGSRVTLESKGKSITYTMVSIHESDPLASKLSTDSPIGAAIMGKRVGETVTVEIPAGEAKYTITKIG